MSVFVCLASCYRQNGGAIPGGRLFKRGMQDMAHCTECEAEITLQGFIVGEIIYCPDCNAELEVLGLEPPALALAPEIQEDWGE